MKNSIFFLISALFMLALGSSITAMAKSENVVAIRLAATILIIGVVFLLGAVNCLKQKAINNKF